MRFCVCLGVCVSADSGWTYTYLHTTQTTHPHNKHSRKKALVARMSEGGSDAASSSGSGSERLKDRAAAVAALRRRGNRGDR